MYAQAFRRTASYATDNIPTAAGGGPPPTFVLLAAAAAWSGLGPDLLPGRLEIPASSSASSFSLATEMHHV